MQASKFSEAQIAFVLKQAEDGTAIGEVPELCLGADALHALKGFGRVIA